MRDLARHRVAVTHHRELAGIDARRAIFAGLVDADHRGGAVLAHADDVVRRRSKVKTSAAAASEKIALKPASEMPNSRHCATSQRMIGAAMISSSEIGPLRSEEHTSELQSLMRISYAVFCLKKKK